MPARSNIWFGLLLGASCILIGFALSSLAYRYHYLRSPGGGMIERLFGELDLTAAQRDRVGDILRDTRFKVMQARQDYEHKRHELFWQGLGQIRGVLTPEQQKLFDRDFKQPWESRHHGDHDGGDHWSSEAGAPPPAPSVPPAPAPQN